MKPVLALAAVATAAFLATGCATPDDSAAQNARPDRYYRTGSNIPVKEAPPPPMTAEERERATDAMRRASTPKQPTN